MTDKTYREQLLDGATSYILVAKADAEIAALRLRVAELEAVQPSALKEKLRSAESRLAELEKDAARYRVVRNREFGFAVHHAVPGWITATPHGQFLDAAIDAALNSTKESST